MLKTNIYGVFDGDQMVFKGTNKEICAKFELNTDSLWGYCYHGWKINRQYTVELIEVIPAKVEARLKRSPKIEKMNKFEYVLDYAIRHLELYGNTVLPDDRNTKQYLKELKKRGYNCELKRYYHYRGDNITLENDSYRKKTNGIDNIIRWLDYDS